MNISGINKILLTLLLFFSCIKGKTQTFDISIFNDFNIKSAVIAVMDGSYKVIADGNALFVFNDDDILYIAFLNQRIMISNRKGNLGQFKQVQLVPITPSSYFKLKPVIPTRHHAFYSGELTARVEYNKIIFINRCPENDYIAGVVLAECGSGKEKEFYKAHVVMSRTYAYKNKSKHSGEGFNMCDGVHCQAFKGLCDFDYIREATLEVQNVVLADKDSNLITSAFHSNCGGETQNAENIWLISRPYLKAVKDPYCTKSPHATWKRTFSKQEWLDYLKRKGVNIASISAENLSFSQPYRMVNYTVGGVKIPLKEIREDWGLLSTFFSVVVSGNNIVLQGRGYGHGIGLCQEGAMQMAVQKFNYRQIIEFYYKNVLFLDLGQVKK